jgi:hypothetical protein
VVLLRHPGAKGSRKAQVKLIEGEQESLGLKEAYHFHLIQQVPPPMSNIHTQ